MRAQPAVRTESRRVVSRRLSLLPWLAALVVVGLDAAKPLVIDDTAYHAVARQIVSAPLDPYGFETFWGNAPQPAMEVLTPPVLPYWLAGAMAAFGDQVPAWKLSLLPFLLILVAGARSLATRFAPGHEVAVACLVVLAPAVAPALNLMLDVPALALGVGALALFARAADGGDLRLALLAGVVAGLALETKYSAASFTAAIAMYGVVFARWRATAVALVAVGAVFLGWEGFVSARYGESHFLHHVFDKSDATAPMGAVAWAVGLTALLAVASPASGLLAVRTWAGRAGGFAFAAAGLVAAVALFMLAPEAEARFALLPDLADPPTELLILAAFGLAVFVAHAPVFVRALAGEDAAGRFLAAWVLIEAVACIALSPFLALRRVVGLSTALIFLAAHALSKRGDAGAARFVGATALAGGVLGLALAGADLIDARARADGFARAQRALVAAEAPLDSGRVWYVGHWGFQFLAERAGMRPLVAGESALRPGDWIVVPSAVLAQRARAPEWARSVRELIEVTSPSPLSTLPNAYGGAVAVRRQPRRQMQIALQRVEQAAVAEDPTGR